MSKKFIIENNKKILFALVIAIFIRSIIIQPFYIPSSSMESTLLVGDRLFVTKFSFDICCSKVITGLSLNITSSDPFSTESSKPSTSIVSKSILLIE